MLSGVERALDPSPAHNQFGSCSSGADPGALVIALGDRRRRPRGGRRREPARTDTMCRELRSARSRARGLNAVEPAGGDSRESPTAEVMYVQNMWSPARARRLFMLAVAGASPSPKNRLVCGRGRRWSRRAPDPASVGNRAPAAASGRIRVGRGGVHRGGSSPVSDTVEVVAALALAGAGSRRNPLGSAATSAAGRAFSCCCRGVTAVTVSRVLARLLSSGGAPGLSWSCWSRRCLC